VHPCLHNTHTVLVRPHLWRAAPSPRLANCVRSSKQASKLAGSSHVPHAHPSSSPHRRGCQCAVAPPACSTHGSAWAATAHAGARACTRVHFSPLLYDFCRWLGPAARGASNGQHTMCSLRASVHRRACVRSQCVRACVRACCVRSSKPATVPHAHLRRRRGCHLPLRSSAGPRLCSAACPRPQAFRAQ
jgi:hypothetical protein